jgi:hypothetical protein
MKCTCGAAIGHPLVPECICKKYEYKTYDLAAFHIAEGMYTIVEVENMLAAMKTAQEIHNKHLKKSIQENNHGS